MGREMFPGILKEGPGVEPMGGWPQQGEKLVVKSPIFKQDVVGSDLDRALEADSLERDIPLRAKGKEAARLEKYLGQIAEIRKHFPDAAYNAQTGVVSFTFRGCRIEGKWGWGGGKVSNIVTPELSKVLSIKDSIPGGYPDPKEFRMKISGLEVDADSLNQFYNSYGVQGEYGRPQFRRSEEEKQRAQKVNEMLENLDQTIKTVISLILDEGINGVEVKVEPVAPDIAVERPRDVGVNGLLLKMGENYEGSDDEVARLAAELQKKD